MNIIPSKRHTQGSSLMVRVLVVGVGVMGFAHAKACASIKNNQIVGLVARDWKKWHLVAEYFSEIPRYDDFFLALIKTKPNVVIISSFTDTHASYAIKALKAGADVFVEKPLATNILDAKLVIATARKYKRKLVVGFILRHHDMWKKFVECTKSLGKPVHLTITSNQHSMGRDWQHHMNILNSGLSPLVDCGVHYTDLMLQVVSGKVIKLYANGTKTNSEVRVSNKTNMTINYSDGSTLDFESGYGPEINLEENISKKAQGPLGFVYIKSENIVIHNDQEYNFSSKAYEKSINTQQSYFFDVIKKDIDLEPHYETVMLSLQIVLNAERIMAEN